jgi:hypothetical protein
MSVGAHGGKPAPVAAERIVVTSTSGAEPLEPIE